MKTKQTTKRLQKIILKSNRTGSNLRKKRHRQGQVHIVSSSMSLRRRVKATASGNPARRRSQSKMRG